MRRVICILGRTGVGVCFLILLLLAGSWALSHLRPRGWTRCDYSKTSNEFRTLAFHSGHGLVAAAWQRYRFGSRVPDIFEEGTGGVQIRMTGGNTVNYPRGWQPVPEAETVNSENQPDAEHWWERIGVRVRISRTTLFFVPVSSLVVIVPYWLLVLIFSIAPGFWLLKGWLRKKFIREGKCGNCGYDLRASPERCPECGAEAKVVSAEH